MWQPSVTTRKEYKNSYRARVGLFIREFVPVGGLPYGTDGDARRKF